jgi:hypothetical protein
VGQFAVDFACHGTQPTGYLGGLEWAQAMTESVAITRNGTPKKNWNLSGTGLDTIFPAVIGYNGNDFTDNPSYPVCAFEATPTNVYTDVKNIVVGGIFKTICYRPKNEVICILPLPRCTIFGQWRVMS